MGGGETPSFEEWANYCFTQGLDDFRCVEPAAQAAIEARERRFCRLEPHLLAAYLTELFQRPPEFFDRFTDAELAAGVWFIFGISSEYMGALMYGDLPDVARTECVQSISSFFTNVLDQACGDHGRDPDIDFFRARPDSLDLDGAVHMIWDMGALGFPEAGSPLVEPLFNLLEAAVFGCRTSACRASGLHGLGHIGHCVSERSMEIFQPRIDGLINRFLGRADVPAWLREYAERARDGNIQ